MQIGGGSTYNLSGTGILAVTGGTHGTTTIDPMLSNGGTINQSGGTLSTVKYSGGGTANLTGGTFSAFYLTNTGAINVKTGGTLEAGEIGGKVVIDGGTLQQNNMQLYLQGGSDVTLKTGSIAPGAGKFWIGSSSGNATLTQTGGAVSYSSSSSENVVIGAVSGSNATANISGGTFTVSAPSNLFLTDDDGAVATVNVSGSAAVSTQMVSVGQHGSGTLNPSGNATWTTNGKDFLSGWHDAAATAAVTISDSAQLTTGNLYPGYAATGSTGANSMTLSDSAKVTVNGNFVPFKGADAENKSGTGQVNVTLGGSSSLSISGNLWGGSNDGDHTVAPMAGQDYAFNLTIGGNSTLSCQEMWAAMTTKTHLTIADSASVTARGGSNSGIGWSASAANSRIDLTGGSLTVNSTNLAIQNQGTFDQSGGSVAAKTILITGGSQYLVSDGTTSASTAIEQKAVLNQSGGEIATPAFNTAAGSATTLTGGTLHASAVTNAGTMTLDGGTLALGAYGMLTTDAGTFDAISGTIDYGMNSGIGWQTGDQVILGKFKDDAQRDAILALAGNSFDGWKLGTNAATGWTVATLGDSAKTDLKIWKDGTSGSMAEAGNWNGDVTNRTGFVTSAAAVTNTFSDFSGVLVVTGGTNTFNGAVEAGERLVINGGTNTYSPSALTGEVLVGAGTFTAGSLAVNGTAANPGSLALNGGTTKITGDLTTATAAGSSASIALTGSANVTVTGAFIAASNNKNTGFSRFSMADNAVMTTGNFWGGNAANSSAGPLPGHDYAAEFLFSGNSYLECKEFWVGMSVPTHIVLEGNAHIRSTTNNTGIGWSDSAANSLFEQRGGTLESVNVKIGEADRTAALSWVQTGGAWAVSGKFDVNSPKAVYSLSGADSSLKISGLTTNRGTVQVSGGSLTAAGIENYKTFSVSGGNVNLSGAFNNKTDSALSVSGGELTASTLYLNGGSTTILSGGRLTMNAGIIGNNSGTVTFNQTGGDFLYGNTATRLQFASAADSTVNMKISGGTFTAKQNMDVSDAANSVVNFNLSGTGQVVANLGTNIGRTGVAHFSLADDSHYAGLGWVYLGGDQSAGKTSTLTMTGNSQFTVGAMTTIGRSGNGVATIGGSAYFQSAILAVGEGGTGLLTVKESGTVEVTTKADVRTKGTISVEGGTLRTPVLTNSGTVTVSGGTLAAEALTNNLLLTVSGGTLQTASLLQSATGTTNLSGGTIALTHFGTIKATAGTFNSDSGTISVSVPTTAESGTQVLVGQFADTNAANAAAARVAAPTGWTAGVINGNYVVLTTGTAPTDMKIWKAGYSGSMTEGGNWNGTAANPVGFVTSGTNSFSDFVGSIIVQDGTNTFEADVPVGKTLAINGGTNRVADISGTLVVNAGTVSRTAGLDLSGTAATPANLEVNGGTMSVTGDLNLAQAAGSQGALTMTGGTLTAQELNLGRTGAGADAATEISGGTMTLSKTVSGGGQLKVSGTGTLAFNSSEAADKISGLSKLEIAGSGANQAGAFRFLKSGTINVSPTLTADAAIRAESDVTVDLLQPVQEAAGSPSTLTKLGAGTLNLRAANSTVSGLNAAEGVLAIQNTDYAGNVAVGPSGTLKVSNTAATSQTFSAPVSAQGNVVFSGTKFNVTGPYQLNGGTFTVDSGTEFSVRPADSAEAQTLTVSGVGDFQLDGELVLNAYGPFSCDAIDLSSLVGEKILGENAKLRIILNVPFESYDYPYTEFTWMKGMDGASLQGIDWSVLVPDGYDYEFRMDAQGRIVSGDLSMIPEPSSFLLLILSLSGSWLCFRRRATNPAQAIPGC